jgi:hypothetical protein
MASAFARRDFEAVARGVRPEVVLQLTGTSWLAGTYRGYEEFGHYLLGSRQVLVSAEKPITYLHAGDEMTVLHDFVVGGSPLGPEIPLHVTVSFDADNTIASLLIQPQEQDAFDDAVDAFLISRNRRAG